MALGKNQARALSGTAGTWAQASEERLADNNVEKILLAAGADSNRQRHLVRGDELRRGEMAGSAHEPVGAKTVR